MKRSFIILNLAILQILTFNVWSAIPESRQRLLIDKNWKFIQSDVKDADKQNFDDSKWRTLNLPHDWSIEGEFKEDAITKGPGDRPRGGERFQSPALADGGRDEVGLHAGGEGQFEPPLLGIPVDPDGALGRCGVSGDEG